MCECVSGKQRKQSSVKGKAQVPFSRKYLTRSFLSRTRNCPAYQLSTFSAKHKKDVCFYELGHFLDFNSAFPGL